MDTSPKSWLDRLVGAAIALCFVALLLVVSVHLVESVASALVIGIGVLSAVGLIAWLVLHHRQNRYW